MPPAKKKKTKKARVNKEVERKLLLKDINQEYGHVEKLLGSCRMEVTCTDGKKRIGIIRGSMQKKIWIKNNDTVLVSLREYEDAKCDIIYLYNAKEVKQLGKMGEIEQRDVDEVKDDIEFCTEDTDDDAISV